MIGADNVGVYRDLSIAVFISLGADINNWVITSSGESQATVVAPTILGNFTEIG